MKPRSWLRWSVPLLIIVCATLLLGAAYPERPVRVIVPFAPGGAVDFTARLIADVAPPHLGQRVLVQNMPGGGAVVGQTFVAQAKPDGYTLLAYTSSVINNPLTKTTTYTHQSFTPVVMYCFDPEVLVVPASSPYRTLEELLAAARSREHSVATAGFSTSHHVAGLVLEKRSGVQFTYIHNQSLAMQLQQLMGGHVEIGFMSFGEAITHAQDGTLRILGIMQKERAPEIPDTPTFLESGIDMEWGTFRGLAVPKETPGEVVDFLAATLKKVVDDPKFVSGMDKAGYPIVHYGPQDFDAYIEKQAEVMREILPTLDGD